MLHLALGVEQSTLIKLAAQEMSLQSSTALIMGLGSMTAAIRRMLESDVQVRRELYRCGYWTVCALLASTLSELEILPYLA